MSIDVMRQLDAEGRLFFPAKDDARLRRKIYPTQPPGAPAFDAWSDPSGRRTHAGSQERPREHSTQKPRGASPNAFLKASSNEGDIVLDPFCGCGTAVVAAQRLKRRSIGIDITPLATNLIKTRLTDIFGPEVRKSYEVIGEPTSVQDARELAKTGPTHFQYWALGLVDAARRQNS